MMTKLQMNKVNNLEKKESVQKRKMWRLKNLSLVRAVKDGMLGRAFTDY